MEQLGLLDRASEDKSAASSTVESMVNIAERWYTRQWIRVLDLALVRFFDRLLPEQDRLVLLALTLVTHQLSRGHTCLDLKAVLENPDWYLALPPEEDQSEPYTDLPSVLLSGVDLENWCSVLAASKLVDYKPHCSDEADAAPLVLDHYRLYLRRQWHYETESASRLLLASQQLVPDWPELQSDLDALFGVQSAVEIDWQRTACALASRRALTLIAGGPGTGKTTTVVRILALLQHHARRLGEQLEIQLAAPTGKAAARLSESIGGAIEKLPENYRADIPAEVSTLHRLLGVIPGKGRYRFNVHNPLSADLVVVDEASMIDLELFHGLLTALKPSARLVLLGDKDQLASVEAGAILGELCSEADRGGYSETTLAWLKSKEIDLNGWITNQGRTGEQSIHQCTVMLRKSHRFSDSSGIGQLARAVNAGDLPKVRAIFEQQPLGLQRIKIEGDGLRVFKRLICAERAPVQGYLSYLRWLATKPLRLAQLNDPEIEVWANTLLDKFNLFRLLTSVRRGSRGVEGLNRLCEQILTERRLINASSEWYAGRPAMVIENDYTLGLMNGDIGICVTVEDDQARVQQRVLFKLADGRLKWVSPTRLQQAETAFAMTVHKSQGSEFAHTALILPQCNNPILTRELIYTAITRAKEQFTLLDSNEQVLEEAVSERIVRASGLYSRVT